MFYTKVEWCIT